jgi:hypothetical protein
LTEEKTLQPVDVNKAFDDILLQVFEEYPKPPEEKKVKVKEGHKYKSKKNKGKK